ncbi:hypothetical protein QTO34_019679 [Cnephaeus nilssonii]|uniref:Large ribosomal subunit protein mL42 n=1 Tax=Cnephaeus nilssonii TaxID=3371016 RepID=A0AA40HX60_CNENI|nr:hypothetical protein QTO34_019679 [Eptesicus nilssonii]
MSDKSQLAPGPASALLDSSFHQAVSLMASLQINYQGSKPSAFEQSKSGVHMVETEVDDYDYNCKVELALTSDGRTIVCYHPSVDIPYEHTKPIPQPDPVHISMNKHGIKY